MVIGLFNDSYEPIIDGVAVCVRSYAQALTRLGCEVYVITSSVPDYTDRADFPVLRFRSIQLPTMPPYRAGIPGLDPDFLRRVYSIPFDIVHSHCPFVAGSLALRIARKRKIPIITTFHSKYREDLRKALYFERTANLALSFLLRYYDAVDYVWVPNHATGKTLREYGYDGEAEVMPNGADLAVPTSEERSSYRRGGALRIGAAEEDFVFLFVGQHRWEKNVRLIIDAMGRLGQIGVRYKMIFAGIGYAEQEMKRLVASHGIEDRVLFLGQILDRESIKQIYARADLFLFPSLYDNAPLVVREAAAFGVPSVLVAGASAAEGVVDGENGFLTENDLDRFVAVLLQIMRSPELLRRVGEGAQRTIYLTWEQVVERVHARYREILDSYRRAETTD